MAYQQQSGKPESAINWNGSHKFLKLYKKEGKDGTPWYMGEFGTQFKITGRIEMDKYANNGQGAEVLTLSLVPVEWGKKAAELKSNQPQQKQVTPRQTSSNRNDGEEVPF